MQTLSLRITSRLPPGEKVPQESQSQKGAHMPCMGLGLAVGMSCACFFIRPLMVDTQRCHSKRNAPWMPQFPHQKKDTTSISPQGFLARLSEGFFRRSIPGFLELNRWGKAFLQRPEKLPKPCPTVSRVVRNPSRLLGSKSSESSPCPASDISEHHRSGWSNPQFQLAPKCSTRVAWFWDNI